MGVYKEIFIRANFIRSKAEMIERMLVKEAKKSKKVYKLNK